MKRANKNRIVFAVDAIVICFLIFVAGWRVALIALTLLLLFFAALFVLWLLIDAFFRWWIT